MTRCEGCVGAGVWSSSEVEACCEEAFEATQSETARPTVVMKIFIRPPVLHHRFLLRHFPREGSKVRTAM